MTNEDIWRYVRQIAGLGPDCQYERLEQDKVSQDGHISSGYTGPVSVGLRRSARLKDKFAVIVDEETSI